MLAMLAQVGCTSAFSLLVDARPESDAVELSKKLASHYSRMGYSAVTTPQSPHDNFRIGRWDSDSRGFIGHAEHEGRLWIWIAPPPRQDDGIKVVEEIKKILTEVAPNAVLKIREARSPDIR